MIKIRLLGRFIFLKSIVKKVKLIKRSIFTLIKYVKSA